MTRLENWDHAAWVEGTSSLKWTLKTCEKPLVTKFHSGKASWLWWLKLHLSRHLVSCSSLGISMNSVNRISLAKSNCTRRLCLIASTTETHSCPTILRSERSRAWPWPLTKVENSQAMKLNSSQLSSSEKVSWLRDWRSLTLNWLRSSTQNCNESESPSNISRHLERCKPTGP